MELSRLYSYIYHFFLVHRWLALCVLVVCMLVLWKKPWLFIKGLAALFAVTAFIYVVSLLNQSAFVGTENKKSITTEREEKLFNEQHHSNQ